MSLRKNFTEITLVICFTFGILTILLLGYSEVFKFANVCLWACGGFGAVSLISFALRK